MERKFGESLDHWKSDGDEKSKSDEGKHSKSSIGCVLYQESLRLNTEKRYNDALTMINVAIENTPNDFEFHSHKAEVLENLNRYSESYQSYNRALELKGNDEIYENRAGMLYKWANSLNDKKKALKLIDEAIETLPDSSRDRYFERFWYLKGSIYDCLGDPLESRRCYMMAEGMADEIRSLDGQIDFLRNSKDTLISITGTMFYFGMEPFEKGVMLKLVREPENEHDPDAIRVEIDGKTVGYVANNEYTLVENTKSASEIKSMNPDRAEVVLIYLDEHVIAKLI